jgi:hypothetical protein
LKQVYYEACIDGSDGTRREKYSKTHHGKMFFAKEAQILFNRANMVRSGIVEHPSPWPFCGYNEIQEPKRKKL